MAIEQFKKLTEKDREELQAKLDSAANYPDKMCKSCNRFTPHLFISCIVCGAVNE